jgi:mannose-6-phosphate isomerase-like protein (cupin superfamily)
MQIMSKNKVKIVPPITRDMSDRVDFTEPPNIRSSFIWADREKGLNHMTFGTCEIEPHSSNAPHAHEDEEEVMFVYQGHGKTLIEDVWYDVGPESLVIIPPGVDHQFVNTGDEIFKFTYTFSPQGMEAKIRKKYKDE